MGCGLPVCAWLPRRSARKLDELLFRLAAMISLVRYLMPRLRRLGGSALTELAEVLALPGITAQDGHNSFYKWCRGNAGIGVEELP
jgi:hypothetical protein